MVYFQFFIIFFKQKWSPTQDLVYVKLGQWLAHWIFFYLNKFTEILIFFIKETCFFFFSAFYVMHKDIFYLLYHRHRFILVRPAKLLTTCKLDNEKLLIHQHITSFYHNIYIWNIYMLIWNEQNFLTKNWFDHTFHMLRYYSTLWFLFEQPLDNLVFFKIILVHTVIA